MWDDTMDQIYIRQANGAGPKDSDAGQTIDVKKARARFGLSGLGYSSLTNEWRV
jgi:hypothetical protein